MRARAVVRGILHLLGAAGILAWVAAVGAPAAAQVHARQPAEAPTLSGTVVTPNGTPIAGAKVTLNGPTPASATTDALGRFTTAVSPGLYQVDVTKGGYVTATVRDVPAIAGTDQTLTVTLQQQDLSSLRTIGTVSTGARGGSTINTSAASTDYLPGAAIAGLANPQINDALQHLPDVNIQHMGSQPDTSIVLGGAQPYETQVLIDGHPVAVGQYGVWLSQFYASFLVAGVETQSGPGNTTPFANTAIGGTVNLLSPAFTKQPTAQLVYGVDNYASQYSNFLTTGSAGSLAYVVGIGYTGSNGPFYQTSHCVISPENTANDNTAASAGIIQFCGDASGSLYSKGEILKLKEDFSPSTSLEAGFIGSFGGYSPQGTSYGQYIGQTEVLNCIPASGTTPAICGNPKYASLAGTTIPGYVWYPGSSVTGTQRMFDAQLRQSIGGDTLLIRPYIGNIEPDVVDGSAESQYPLFFSAPGTVPSYAPGTPIPANPNQNAFENYCNNETNFLGQIPNPAGSTTVTGNGQEECYQTAFSEYEIDKLYGSTVSYIHPFGDNVLNFTYDYHGLDTFAYYNTPSNIAVPDTTERYTTFSLSGELHPVRNLAFDVGLYDTNWKLFGEQPVGQTTNLTGLTRSVTRFDPHVALVFQPRSGLSYRAAYGSSETFPFAGQVSGLPFSTPPSATAPTGIFQEKNPYLSPEFSTAYNVGVDKRFHSGAVLSVDLTDTTIHNVFETVTIPSEDAAVEETIEPVNVARLRAELATLRYAYAPFAGLGYNLAAAAERSIVDGLPSSFFANGPGLPANGQQICGTGLSTPGIPVCIPYLKGYGQITYQWRDGTFAGLGVDYEGKNNSYYQPPFAQVDLQIRRPVRRDIDIQVAVQNLLNTNAFSYLAEPNAGTPQVAGSTAGLTTIPTTLIPTLPRTVRVQMNIHTGR